MKAQQLGKLGLHRLDLLCGFMFHEMGIRSLQAAPALLMGFRSIERSPLLREREVELENLRRVCSGLSTITAVKAATVRYNDSSMAAGHRRHFRINERTLSITPLFDVASKELKDALDALRVPYAPQPHGLLPAEAGKPLSIQVQYAGESRRYPIDHLPPALPQPGQHEAKSSQKPVVVTWASLLAEARAMDAIDKEQQVGRRGNWYERLAAVALHGVDSAGGFQLESELNLDGLRHLIGLPGAGKTTLLMCLLRHLGMRNLKVAVFFPSIEVCRQYLDDLRRYGVRAGLLVGQSRETRLRHAHRLAESLASDDKLGGFGSDAASSGLFEGVCALPGLTSAPSEAFGIADSFCTRVLQSADSEEPGRQADRSQEQKRKSGSFEGRLCPLWSRCGFTRAARELTESNIWLGHVLSADTRVPRHTSGLDERYFELIGRTFDVVVFDEADRAQQDLDNGGIAELSLSGSDRSYHRQVQRGTLDLFASGQNAVLHGLDYAQLAIEIAEFEKLNIALTHAILRLTEPTRKDFDGLLMSPLRIIGDWLSPRSVSRLTEDTFGDDPQAKAKDALCVLWEGAAIRAFQQRGGRGRESQAPEDSVNRMAGVFGLTPMEAREVHDSLTLYMGDWLAESNLKELGDTTEKIVELLRNLRRPMADAEARELVGLLLPVTFTILSYRRFSPRLNEMVEQGMFDPIHIDKLASKALLQATPENILGSLSGVRFFSTTSSSGASQANRGAGIDLQLQYVVFTGTPRLLMYRLHEWNTHKDGTRSGPAVLLTSATSFLPASPAYHVAVPPHYVLRRLRPERDDAPPSRYVFRPVKNGSGDDTVPLRFSGERSEASRFANLEKMAIALLEGGPTNSLLASDIDGFDIREGMGRKAAFVVNSYDQALRLKRAIDLRLPSWRDKVVAVVADLPEGPVSGVSGYVTASRVEALGDDPNWKVLIFPSGALGRGTNVVFTSGPRRRDAVIGTLYFLTRPHPAPNDMGLMVSMAAEATLKFDLRPQDSASLDDIAQSLTKARGRAYRKVGQLMRRPLYARALGELFEPFTANMAVSLLQTIGRAMRNGCPVQCFFVDRAWAERSARDQPDNEKSSMLVQLRRILERGISDSDPRIAALHQALYGAFLDPLSKTEFLRVAGEPDNNSDEPWTENPFWEADAPFETMGGIER
jgi:hypothetical protein